MDGDPEALAGLERWAADARARDAADARVRERWLRAQAEEDASLEGVLVGLAEGEEAVVVTTVDGRRHGGLVAGVGVDFLALTAPGGTTTLVALGALSDVRAVHATAPRRRSASGDRRPPASLGVRLVDVLAQAAGQRPRVSVRTPGNAIVGDLRAVGSDVLTLRTDGRAGVGYVRLASVSEISFLASG